MLDTNILLHLANPDSSENETARKCLELLWERGDDLTYTSQNLAEFWNVCTRPADKNGFGLSISETNERALLIETRLRLAEDSAAIHLEWRRLIVDVGVSGKQVHDARLVAAMRVHEIGTIITSNLQDFRRFEDVVAVSPVEILASIDHRS